MPPAHHSPASGAPRSARLVRAATRVRRALLERRRFLAALLLGVAVLAGLRVAAPPPPATRPAPVASRDLPAGAVLGADDLEVRRVPPESRPDGLVPAAEARGRTLAAPVRRGEALTDARLAGPGLAAAYPGRVAVPVRIPDPAVVDLLRVGDEVEVLAVGDAGGARTVAVARVAGLPRGGGADGVAAGTAGAPPGRLVLLAATATGARELSAAAVRDYLTVVWSG